MEEPREQLELDRFEAERRKEALLALAERLRRGAGGAAATRGAVNLHYHTFFSYNAEGMSPSHIAWRARRAGLAVAGVVDFDVLDGLEEFLEAGRALSLRACVGIETRVFVPEYAEQELDSPGEPGVSYSVGMGFARRALEEESERFLAGLRATAAARCEGIIARLASHLVPLVLDYQRDVVPLTPSGNATERHICVAYAGAARARFRQGAALAEFWSDRLGIEAATLDLPDGIGLQQAIRSRLMKQGGQGYVPPDTGSFPQMEAMHRFVVAAGGIPAYAWLNGRSEGEGDTERLLDTMVAGGAEAVNIIPDRNYTPGENDGRLAKLREIVSAAEARALPIFVGTEMNAPGQKFVDDFESAELKPLAPAFLRGAYIAYGHTVLQRAAGLGYTSAWVRRCFGARGERNEFYEAVGRLAHPGKDLPLTGLDESASPESILKRLRRKAQV